MPVIFYVVTIMAYVTQQAGGWKDKTLAASGLSSIKFQPGEAGKAKIGVSAKGGNLPDSMLPATSFDVQLIDWRNDVCWGSSFGTGMVRGQYKAKVSE